MQWCVNQIQNPNVLNEFQEKNRKGHQLIRSLLCLSATKGSRCHSNTVPWYEVKHIEDAFCSVNLASVLHTNTIWVSVAKTNMGLGLKELHLRDSCESPTSPDFLSTLWKLFHKRQPQNTWPQVKFMFKWQDIEEKKKEYRDCLSTWESKWCRTPVLNAWFYWSDYWYMFPEYRSWYCT